MIRRIGTQNCKPSIIRMCNKSCKNCFNRYTKCFNTVNLRLPGLVWPPQLSSNNLIVQDVYRLFHKPMARRKNNHIKCREKFHQHLIRRFKIEFLHTSWSKVKWF
ncbi:protein trichome birefringence [Trifolium repens]|nr:protein trichome birefringence [Trifolium repens]